MCRKILLLALFSFLYVATIAQSEMVTLFEKCNYSGAKHMLVAGTYRVNQMKVGNDKLSSMTIPIGLKVTIYEHDKFEGRSKTYYSNTACLEDDWRNMASSLVVERNYAQQPLYGEDDYVIFFNDCNSIGYSQSLRPGNYTGIDLGSSRYNISSFTISGNLRVRAYLNSDNLSGASTIYEASVNCLPGYQNDNIGSLTIEYKPLIPIYPINGNYASVYTDCNYYGNSLRLAPGYYQGNKLGLLKYNISSIELPSNLTAKVYVNNEHLAGSYYTISSNISCMSVTMNDKIGSLIIEENNDYNQNQFPPPYNRYEKVVLYADKDYKGLSASLLPGRYNTMAQAGFYDNTLSSLTIPPGYRVVLYDKVNFKGSNYTLTASRSGLSLPGWNDKASSIAVYRDF